MVLTSSLPGMREPASDGSLVNRFSLAAREKEGKFKTAAARWPPDDADFPWTPGCGPRQT